MTTNQIVIEHLSEALTQARASYRISRDAARRHRQEAEKIEVLMGELAQNAKSIQDHLESLGWVDRQDGQPTETGI